MNEKFHKKSTQTKNLKIHNDLAQAADYLTSNVAKKVSDNITDALTFDCMAAGVMLAFTYEAYLNFMGDRLIAGWDEMAKIEDKEAAIFDYLKLAPDWSRRPDLLP